MKVERESVKASESVLTLFVISYQLSEVDPKLVCIEAVPQP